jgi:hypothetical protein
MGLRDWFLGRKKVKVMASPQSAAATVAHQQPPKAAERHVQSRLPPADFILVVSAEKVVTGDADEFMQQLLRAYDVQAKPSTKWAVDSHQPANDLKRCAGYAAARLHRYCLHLGIAVDVDDIVVKPFELAFHGHPISGHFFLCFSEHQNLESTILDLNLFSDKEKEMLRGLIKGSFGITGDEAGVLAGPPAKFSKIRLVMVLNKAVQEKFKGHLPNTTAAVFLAMTDKNRDDLVERPEGIYLSRQCAQRISSYEVWLTGDGSIIVTRRKREGEPDEAKEDSQRLLNERLPNAQRIGEIDSFQYALGLAMTFGLDESRLLVGGGAEKGVAIL